MPCICPKQVEAQHKIALTFEGGRIQQVHCDECWRRWLRIEPPVAG